MWRFDAVLNDRSLCEIDASIILVDISERAAEQTILTESRAMKAGTWITNIHRERLSVRLTFVIRERDVVKRSQIMDDVIQWASNGGWLSLSTRPSQKLYVNSNVLPALGSALRWTDEIIMELTAYERPYWEQVDPTVETITDSGTITPDGTVPDVYVECDVVNNGADDLTAVALICDDTFIALEGLAVPSGGHVVISYTDKDVLTITADGESALSSRTAESHDDLIARSRQENSISVEADQPVEATFSARGRYL